MYRLCNTPMNIISKYNIVLSGPVWSYLAMSCPLWNCTVFLSSMVFYDNVLYCVVLYFSSFSCTVQSTMVLCTPVRVLSGSCTTLYVNIWFAMAIYGPIRSCLVLCGGVCSFMVLRSPTFHKCIIWSSLILCGPICSHMNLFELPSYA